MFGMIKTKKKKKLNVLISIEFGLYFKKYFFLLVSGIIILYVRCILDIK
jgi:hypothetical protein